MAALPDYLLRTNPTINLLVSNQTTVVPQLYAFQAFRSVGVLLVPRLRGRRTLFPLLPLRQKPRFLVRTPGMTPPAGILPRLSSVRERPGPSAVNKNNNQAGISRVVAPLEGHFHRHFLRGRALRERYLLRPDHRRHSHLREAPHRTRI